MKRRAIRRAFFVLAGTPEKVGGKGEKERRGTAELHSSSELLILRADTAKCHTYVPFGSNIFPIAINKVKFDSMPGAAKDILMKHSDLPLVPFYAKAWDGCNDAIEQKQRANSSTTHIDLNAEQAEAWKKALDSATQGWLKTNPKFPALLDMYCEEVAKAREYIKAHNP